MSSVAIIYRKGGVIFKIKIFNIYQGKKAGVARHEAPEKPPPLLPTHKPHISLLTEQSVTMTKEKIIANLYNPIQKKGRTFISNK